MIDRKIFFDRIRAKPFGGSLKPETVKGVSAVLDEWERRKLTNLWWLADMLATVLGECGRNMLPVREGFKETDAQSRAYVRGKGYKYAAIVNGQAYYGRGLVQLTWEANYRSMAKILGIDLLGNPDLALQPEVAAQIMFEGMIRGTFTSKKLADFDFTTRTGRVQARRIINILDRADELADYCEAFHAALVAAHVAGAPAGAPAPAPAPAPSSPAPAPAPVAPEPAPESPAPAAPQSPPAPPAEKGFWDKFGDLFRPKKD